MSVEINKCSQCNKGLADDAEFFEDGVCEDCNEENEAAKVECPLCEATYTNDDDISTKNGRTCCYLCHNEYEDV